MNNRSVSSSFVTPSNSYVSCESRTHNNRRERLSAILAASLLIGLISLLLAACSNPFSGGGSTPTATPANLPLAQLRWCEKPSMVFRDEGAHPSPTPTAAASVTPTTTATASATATGTVTPVASPTAGPGTPTTVTDWSTVKANLGFTVYLPTTLPRGTCLVSTQATFHDPTVGGNFLIGYLLPDHASVAISEAPLISQGQAFQCLGAPSSSGTATPTPKAGTPQPTSTPTQTPLLVCSGAKSNTNIVLSARSSQAFLQQLFNGLQPNVAWIPAS